MSEWWLFRNTRIENINEQYEIARKHLPDTTHWLGSEYNYFYIKCCDVARSVYSDGDILKGEISPRRPIQSGDTLYVANIYVLGGTLPTIQKTLKPFTTSRYTCEFHRSDLPMKMIATTMSYYPEHLVKSITTVRRSLSSSLQDTGNVPEDRNVVYH